MIETASWIILDLENHPVMETFNKRIVENLNTKKYKAVPILEYLCDLNNHIRETHE